MAQAKHQQAKTTNPLDFFIERGGKVIQNENGWCNYYVDGEVAYLENMYIYPEKRKSQNGTCLLSQLEMQLVELDNCKYLFTSISRTMPKQMINRNLTIALKRGFEFNSSTDSLILLKKELK